MYCLNIVSVVLFSIFIFIIRKYVCLPSVANKRVLYDHAKIDFNR